MQGCTSEDFKEAIKKLGHVIRERLLRTRGEYAVLFDSPEKQKEYILLFLSYVEDECPQTDTMLAYFQGHREINHLYSNQQIKLFGQACEQLWVEYDTLCLLKADLDMRLNKESRM